MHRSTPRCTLAIGGCAATLLCAASRARHASRPHNSSGSHGNRLRLSPGRDGPHARTQVRRLLVSPKGTLAESDAVIRWAGGVLSASACTCALGFPSASSIDYRGVPARALLFCRITLDTRSFHRTEEAPVAFHLAKAVRCISFCARGDSPTSEEYSEVGRYHMISILCGPWKSSTVVLGSRHV